MLVGSRVGSTTLRASISDRMPQGVVYTTFHHPFSGANVITTENSDWATNCPEYKVTAVQVTRSNRPSDWQAERERLGHTNYKVTLPAAGRAMTTTVRRLASISAPAALALALSTAASAEVAVVPAPPVRRR